VLGLPPEKWARYTGGREEVRFRSEIGASPGSVFRYFGTHRCFAGGSASVVLEAFRPRGLIVNLALLKPHIQVSVVPNKAPEPTTMAGTSRAPSSTARASHGRGSS
jgi:hypothetical protein